MAELRTETRNELVLAQNEHAFIQDETKGVVQVIVGPYKTGLTTSDKPVRYEPNTGKFIRVSLEESISQNPCVSEDSYVVLENPSKEIDKYPGVGSQAPTALQSGRKINIPGPTIFALWPGQVATVISGHQLKSNEYIVVRVYSVEEAKKNWPKDALDLPEEVVVGQLLVIKGTDVSFFIPPTGLEVVVDPNTKQYVRQAVTLEQLEYCILLDENGTKRYERGPQVVFPEATEKFISRKAGSATAQGDASDKTTSVKFKAVELNDQMGLYIKVIADYTDNGREFKTGEELFITGKDQRIYYPRPEHALIEYGSGDQKRQRYYGIAIPKGEARYVLDKNTGKVEMIRGEKVFLPDPRHQVIVRRVLSPKQVGLWYPGNQEAVDYNLNLASLAEETAGGMYVNNDVVLTSAVFDASRTINRGTSQTLSAQNVGGQKFNRGTSFTPPPQITLNTKYDGPPLVNVWTGYAVQVLDKAGNRRVVKGPATLLLEYDESLEQIVCSTGNPKNTDNLKHDVYLRVDHNKISDTIEVESKDMVTAKIKLSYRVNFEGDPEKWFAVENYVKFMCDHARSLLRGVVKKAPIKDLIDNCSSLVRDSLLGTKPEKNQRPGLVFPENGMRIYDLEVLGLQILDGTVADMISKSQKTAVQDSLTLTLKQQELENFRVLQQIEQQILKLKHETLLNNVLLEREQDMALNKSSMEKLNEEILLNKSKSEASIMLEKLESEKAAEKLARQTNEDNQMLQVEREQAKLFVERMQTVNPKLADAIQRLADNNMLGELAKAVAPLAIMEQQGVDTILKKLFKSLPAGSNLENLLESK